ncbi:MAG: ABC transporter ATP-binding protein [Anaerolineae bacterium]|nr:ABC transporter ATP-binding protein [Anaerolineae bacterium]
MSQTIDPKLLQKLSFDLKSTVNKNRLVGLWRVMDGFRWLYAGAMLAIVLGAFIRVYYYRVVQYVIDTVVGEGQNSQNLPWLALSFVGLAVLEGTFAYLRGVWSAKTAEGIVLRLRDYLYDHMQRLAFAFHDYAKTGELIQRSTSDVDAMRRFYADQALGIGRIAALFVVNFAMLLRMNTKIGLLAIVVMPFIVVMSYWFFGRVSKAYNRYQEQEAKLSTVLQENLTGVRVVKAFARQPYEIDKFDRENWERYRLGKKLLIMHSLYWPLSDILCAAQTILVQAVSALMAVRGEITVGTYIAVMGMLTWIIWPMRNLGRLIVQVSTGLVSYRRVADVIEQDREDIIAGSVPLDTQIRGAIAFEHVSFAYEPMVVLQDEEDKKKSDVRIRDAESEKEEALKPVAVLHDISFRCAPGNVVALLGSTGSGKTSIINLLLRFYDYQEGSLKLDGVELTEYPRSLLRRNIGIVEQEPFLFSRSIRDNIAYGADREVTQEEIERAAQAAAIHDIVLTFPDGYDTIVGEKGVTLSGGQRQRVAIARALLKDPRILVLDDATSSVDTETEEQIQQALDVLIPGRTTFIVAHRIQTVMNADLILVLDKGHIVQSGTHADLIQQPGLYHDIYEIQSRIEEEVAEEVECDEAEPAFAFEPVGALA